MNGKSLGPYELIRLLGRGGMGEVYLARDPRLGREVALKVLPSDLGSSPQRRERFLREARSVSALNHPNITTIHEIGEADSRDYIAFEHVDGRTLEAILREGGGLPLERLLDLTLPIAEALQYAHGKGIVHRDLKPANVMVSELGIPKILDFGLGEDDSCRCQVQRSPDCSQAHRGRRGARDRRLHVAGTGSRKGGRRAQ